MTLQKGGLVFVQRLLKYAVLDRPTLDSVRVSRGRFVAVAVGCTSMALQWNFNGTFRALPRHFLGTSKVLYWQLQFFFIVMFAFILIGRESVSPVCGIFFCVIARYMLNTTKYIFQKPTISLKRTKYYKKIYQLCQITEITKLKKNCEKSETQIGTKPTF